MSDDEADYEKLTVAEFRKLLRDRDDARRRLADAEGLLARALDVQSDKAVLAAEIRGFLIPSTPTAEPPLATCPHGNPAATCAQCDVVASRPTALDAATERLHVRHRELAGKFCVEGLTDAEAHELEVVRAGLDDFWMKRWNGTAERSDASPKSESPPPAGPTGMEPGRRCTLRVDEHDGKPHEWGDVAGWIGAYEMQLKRESRGDYRNLVAARCPYVEPPAGPVCASWCGGYATDAPDSASGWRWGGMVDRLFCTKACMDARRPLHPEVPHGT